MWLAPAYIDLTALEAKLKDYDLATITKQLKKQRYDILIPKFKVEYGITLNNVLANVRNSFHLIFRFVGFGSMEQYNIVISSHLDEYGRDVFK